MKNLLLIFSILFLFTCSKDEADTTNNGNNGNNNGSATIYCASCREAKSRYSPPEFCDISANVDYYINQLKEEGKKYNQSWSCSKRKK